MIALVSNEPIGSDTFSYIWEKINEMALDKTATHEHNEGKEGSFRHSDGFGLAWFGSNKTIKSYHNENPIWEIKLEDELINEIALSNFLLIHARKASPGLAQGNEYCHPFVRNDEKLGQFIFAHNGTIKELEKISYDSSLYKPFIRSDTERFLYSIMTNFRAQNNLSDMEILDKTIKDLPEYSGANYFLIYNNNLYGSTNFMESPKYLNMYYGENDNVKIVSSESFEGLDLKWNKLQNHDIVKLPLIKENKIKIENN